MHKVHNRRELGKMTKAKVTNLVSKVSKRVHPKHATLTTSMKSNKCLRLSTQSEFLQRLWKFDHDTISSPRAQSD